MTTQGPDDFDADLAAYRDDCRLADLAERTIDGYVDQLARYHQWCQAAGCKTTTVRAAKAYLVEVHGRSQWTAYMASRALKSYGRWMLVEYGTDPFASLAYVRQPKPVPQRTATAADVAQLLLGCDDTLLGLRDAALIHVLSSTGMRRSEVAAMCWTDVDLATGTVSIPKTKGGRPRTARLGRDAQRAVRRYRRGLASWDGEFRRGRSDRMWVSMTAYTPLSSNAIHSMLERRCKASGVDLTAHAFRRAAAVAWLTRGGSETLLRETAGWRSPRMVEAYVRQVAASSALAEHARLFG